MENPIVLPTQKLEEVLIKSNLEESTKIAIRSQFWDFYSQVTDRTEQANGIIVTSIDDKAMINKAWDLRKELKKYRTTIENRRKELKEESLRRTQAIDWVAKILKDYIQPLEDYLESQEKFAALEMERIRNELEAKRKELCDESGIDYTFVSLKDMDEDTFNKYFETQKKLADDRKRFLEEQAIKEEQDRIQKEQERIKMEKDLAIEREARAKADQEAAQARAFAQAEQQKRLLAEQQAAQQAEQARQAEEKRQAEIKAAEQAELQKALEVKRQLELQAAAPDREKILLFAQTIKDLPRPQMATPLYQEKMLTIKFFDFQS